MTAIAVQIGQLCYPILAVLGWLATAFLVASLLNLAWPRRSPSKRHVAVWKHATDWCAGLALMIGFLGTISGMRSGMDALTDGSGPIDLGALGGDLSYAFTTTLIGLCVAALASLAHLLLQIGEERVA